MFSNTLKNLKESPKTWLITGCAGFIGSNLAEFLLLNGQKVVGLDNFSTGKRENITDIKQAAGELASNFKFIEGDITNAATCLDASQGVNYILHQAALGSVPRSIEDPVASHNSNVNGHLNMLMAAKDKKVESFVYASSSAVYGDHPTLPKVESQTGNALSPYAVTKCVNELYANVFHLNYNLKTIGIRYFNVFGKRQDPDSIYAAVMPKWIKAMMDEKDVFIFGDGTTSRDFCYIDNVIQMNILAATTQKQEAFGQAYNCACAERTDLNTLFEYLKSGLLNKHPHLKDLKPNYQDFRDGDIKHSHANISKAQETLGYQPSDLIKEGLAKSLNWYMENL